MKKKSTAREWESSPMREELEAFARQGVQRLLRQVLEEEVHSVRQGVDLNARRRRPAS